MGSIVPNSSINNLGISTTFIADGNPLYNALDQIKNIGLGLVELGSNHCFEGNYEYLNNYPFNYLVHNYFPIPRESFVVNIASFNDLIRKKSINHIKNAIDFCSTIDAKLYTFHPGFLTDPKGSNIGVTNYDFQWDDMKLKNVNFKKAKKYMFLALDEIIKYAEDKQIRIAIETEGSITKKNHLLMQNPEEYEELTHKYSNNDLGINLNIGHLQLASNAFGFDCNIFIDQIQDYIVAIELSHNDGSEDQHLPLEPIGWYWNLINDYRFKDTYKILEYRNTDISQIKKTIRLFEEISVAFS